MRVLVSCDVLGGVWTHARELCRGLTASGDRVLLAALGGIPDADERRELEQLGVELHARPLRLEWQHELVERFAPDVVHLNTFGAGAPEWRVPTLVVAHSCVRTWWRAVHGCA